MGELTQLKNYFQSVQLRNVNNPPLYIEILDLMGVIFNEFPAGLDLVAHQNRKHLVGFHCVFQGYL
jgi:hypothetical protein